MTSYSHYAQLIKRATLYAVCISIFLIIIKFITFWLTGSLSLFASLLDSSIDLLASGLNFLLVRYALKPPDEGHTFGHGKAESLAALAQSAFIIGSLCFFLFTSIKALFFPIHVVMPLLGILISFVSIIMTLILVLYQNHIIKLTQSKAISADKLHYSADLFVNIAVILSLFLSWYGIGYADAIFAFMIAIILFYNACKIAYSSIQDLLDRALPPHINEQILQIALSFSEVHGVHDLKTRQAGPMKFIQLHIELDDNLPLIKAHSIADNIEKLIAKTFKPAEVIIHQDPLSVLPQEMLVIKQNQTK